jgi:multiple sugar transport system substrate-binding protein
MRRTLTRRSFLGSAVASAAVLLAACSQPAAPTAALAKPAEPTKPAAAPAAAQAPASAPGATIRRMYWGSPDQVQIEQEVDKRFTDANPGLKIEPIPVPWPSYRDKLLTMLAGGDVPNVMMVDAYWFPAFIGQKVLRPLDDYLQKDTEYAKHKVIKGFWPLPDHHSADGKVYSKVHSGDTPRIIYFNANMFKEAGIQDPIEQDKAGKWTMDAYLDAAKKLTKGSGVDKVFGAAAYPLSSSVYNFVGINGGGLLSADKKKSTMSDPATLEAIQFQIDMIRVHKVSPLPEEDQVLGGPLKAFMAKKLGMFISGIWTGADTRNVKDFEWAVAPLPKGVKTGYRRTIYKPNSTSMPASSKAVDEAWKWMAFDPLGQNKLMIDKFTDMAMFEENKQYFLEKSPVKNAKAVFDAFDNNEQYILPITTKYLEIEKIQNDNITLARNGEKSLADVAKVVDQQVNALLGG